MIKLFLISFDSIIIFLKNLIEIIPNYKFSELKKMQNIIDELLNSYETVRYVAIYLDGILVSKEKKILSYNSSSESDKYEELLCNPIILTAARQRGNIDCGGLKHILIAYGSFYQFIKEISGGHISICLDKSVNTHLISQQIETMLETDYPNLFQQ